MPDDDHHLEQPIGVDVVVVGAGFAGMYQLIRLRESGRTVQVIEAGSDVGGTWYWNRYPGARCDVPSMEYSLSFDPDLEQEWEWTELMAGQPEILSYARHVADRHDLRPHIQFDTKVVAAHFGDDTGRWSVTTDRGQRFDARFVVMATGCLSVANTPELPGRKRFAGRSLHTGDWPKEPVEFDGQRVGVIGTGSSGVQAIPVIGAEAGHLTVFQRTPVYTFPANNRPLKPEAMAAYKEHYQEVRERQRHSVAGFSGFSPKKAKTGADPADEADGSGAEGREAATAAAVPEVSLQTSVPYGDGAATRPPAKGLLDVDPSERSAAVARYGPGVVQRYRDVYTDPAANEVACELYREEVDRLVDEPAVAEALKPTDYPLGCKRQVFDTGYYETFNRPNVELVDLRATPLVEITETGVRTTAGHTELDILVYATGFDAMTGALDRIDIRGREGRRLRNEWAGGPRTYLGLAVAGFPNLFTITGPGSPSVLSNMVVSIEQHVDWIMDCLAHLDRSGHATIEATEEAQVDWARQVAETAEGSMYTAPGCASWYLGANIEGKSQVFMPYLGGVGRYRRICDEVRDADYRGFVLN
ncbi:MAG: NAD(P)/FAD-dependent oxidoreductase [Actinomycetota bacterium]